MKKKTLNFLGGALTALVLTVGCSRHDAASVQVPSAEGLPVVVRWADAFNDLHEIVLEANTKDSLSIFLKAPFPDQIEAMLAGGETAQLVVSSCKELLHILPSQVEAVRPYEQGVLNQNLVLCMAAHVLQGATASLETHLPTQTLGKNAPNYLPKGVALFVSADEYDRWMGDPAVSTWGQVHSIVSVEEISPLKAHYVSSTGEEQTLQELGRGDINHDGQEDLLLLSQDSLSGGSFRHVRLLLLTVGPDGHWHLLPNPLSP